MEINMKIWEHMLGVLKEAAGTGFLSMGAALSLTTRDICAGAKLSEKGFEPNHHTGFVLHMPLWRFCYAEAPACKHYLLYDAAA